MTTFALIGFGFRAENIWKVSAGLPDLTCVGAVVRKPRELPVPTYPDLEECFRAARPDFVITAVPRTVNAEVISAAVANGLPVLAETPPAADLPGLRHLWQRVGATGLVQVAEQYPYMPTHAARAAAVSRGIIGTPTQVQISSTQQYHAVALIRAFLNAGYAPATVRATRTVAPLVQPLTRQGWSGDPDPKPATTTIATIDFGAGRSGLYDFTDNQTRNLLRFRRILVRGTHGELRDDEIVHLAETNTLARIPLVRRQTGHDLDLNGFDTQEITLGSQVMYRNPFPDQRWNDDEIATATMLRAMAKWVTGDGPAPYPLASAAQDQLVALAVEQAADTDQTVTTTVEQWAS